MAKVIPLLTKRGTQGDCSPEPAEFAGRRRDGDAPRHRNAGGAGPSGRPFMGGAVISEAGNHAQVKGLVYVAAGAPESGQSFGDWWKDYAPAPAAAEIKPYGEGYVALTPEGVRKHFVQDIPADEADIVYATQGPLAARCFSDKVLESVRRDHAGLHSFLSMSLIEARRRNASALRLRFSQSLARRLHRPSHANVRSTTHRFGRATNPFA